jgi:hypothetical protein
MYIIKTPSSQAIVPKKFMVPICLQSIQNNRFNDRITVN